jgi:hypothetical protein
LRLKNARAPEGAATPPIMTQTSLGITAPPLTRKNGASLDPSREMSRHAALAGAAPLGRS